MRQFILWLLKLRPRQPRRGESFFSYALIALVILVVFSRVPSAITKSNPLLSLILAVAAILGALWLHRFIDDQLRQLPFARIFDRWVGYCSSHPDSRVTSMSPVISIIIYSPLLVIPFLLGQSGRELMIPVACMGYAVLAYCMEALVKALILKKMHYSDGN
jgi:hypothetical protein